MRILIFWLFLICMMVLTLKVSFEIALNRVRSSERHMDQATEYLLHGQFDLSLEHFEKALVGNPRKRQAWSGKGLSLLYLGRYSEALESYERILRMDPDNAQAWLGKAMSFEYLDRFDEALLSYDQTLKIDSKFGMAVTLRRQLIDKRNGLQR